MTIVVPVLLGMSTNNGRHAILGSTFVGIAGAAVIVSYSLYCRGADGSTLDGQLKALTLIGTGAAISTLLGWITNRLASPFRTEQPRVALRKAAFFILSLAAQIAALAIVVDALGLVGIIDFTQAPPTVIYYYWKGYQFAYVAVALLIVLAWSVRYSRPLNVGLISTPRLILFRVCHLPSLRFSSFPS